MRELVAQLGLSYHGVLAHQDDASTTHGLANLVHLLRGHIVDCDDEDRLVLVEQPLELVEVSGLVCGLAPHFCDLSTRIGIFQASLDWYEVMVWEFGESRMQRQSLYVFRDSKSSAV